MIKGGGSGDDASSRVLNQLQFIEGLERETKRKGIAVIFAGSDQIVNEKKKKDGQRQLFFRRWKYADRMREVISLL